MSSGNSAAASHTLQGQLEGGRVVIVLLNWNGRDDTLECLDSVRPALTPERTLLVVDNGSSDDSVSAIRAAFPDVVVLETGRNLGYAGGNNVGIERAVADAADFVLVLNNDTRCAPDMIERLLEAAARNPRAGMFCPRIFYMDDPRRVWFDGARWNPDSLYFGFPGKDRFEAELPGADQETDYASGAALFVRADVIRETGAFDDRYFLVWEEADWCYRARERGWSSVVVPSAKLWHRVGASFGSEASPLRTYFSSRNRLVWLFRHRSFPERLRAVVEAAWNVVPRWHISKDAGVPWPKRFAWAVLDWAASAAGHGQRLEYLAKRRAFFDFLFHRLGPTPGAILEWNRRWMDRRAKRLSVAAA